MVTSKAVANIWDQFQNFDRNTLTPYAVGFDRVFDRLNDYAMHQATSTGFPPYNIRKVDEFNYQVEMAVAGYGKDDIEVKVEDGTLTVRSTNETNDVDENVIHQGIAKRKFTREFALADDVVVKDASLKDGLLVVHMEKIVPEEKKPRVIEVK